MQIDSSRYRSVSPGTEVVRVLNESELRKQPKAEGRGNGSKEGRVMETAKGESTKIMNFSAKLPTNFVKEFKEKKYELHRTGENRWELDGKGVGGIREAMNAILEKHGGNNGRTADHFFNCGLVEGKRAAKEQLAAMKGGEAKATPKSKKAKAKKGKTKKVKGELPFSKAKQTGRKTKAETQERVGK